MRLGAYAGPLRRWVLAIKYRERWSELGRPDMYSRAREKVEEILAAPPKNPLPDDVIGELEAIARRADEELN